MKNSIITLLFVFALFSFTACVKDNSNTNFNDLNKITIEKLPAQEVTLGGRLIVTPTVTSTDDDISFIWYTYSRISGSKRDTLSTEKNLDVVIGGANAVPGEQYKLVFRVYDNKSGVFVSQETDFAVNSQYTKGLLMLCEDGQDMELNMLLSNNTVLDNIFSKNNSGQKLSKKFKEVTFTNPNPIKLVMKNVLLFADDENGGYVLDPITMSEKSTVRNMFDDPISDPIVSVRGYSGLVNMIEYIYLNNKLCKRVTNMGVFEFQSSPLVVSNSTKDFSIQNFVYKEHQPIVYDDMNGRLLAHAPWNKGTLIRINESMSSKEPFDGDNLGNYSMESSGQLSVNNYWMLMKDKNTNERVVFKYILEKRAVDRDVFLAFTPLSKTVISSSIAPNLKDATIIFAHSNISKTCLYIANNKIYNMNIDMINQGSSALAEVELASLSGNINITGGEYYTLTTPDPTPENPNATKITEQIRLFVQDNNLTSAKGGLIYYELTTGAGLGAKEVYRKIGGFCDRVVDIVEKDS